LDSEDRAGVNVGILANVQRGLPFAASAAITLITFDYIPTERDVALSNLDFFVTFLIKQKSIKVNNHPQRRWL